SVWRPALHLCAAGEGGSTATIKESQPLFIKNHTLFEKIRFFTKFQRVTQLPERKALLKRNFIPIPKPQNQQTSSNQTKTQVN
ncbi:hypothetical protein, partial [Shimia thalassica]|uniref:hypothetical protein n=1 Tax=Shimia thalassica TaxID=1715693 RepID=UPI002493E2C6